MRYWILFFLLIIPATLIASPPTPKHPVIFIHGIGGNFDHWAPAIEAITSDSATLRFNDANHIEMSLNGTYPHPPMIWNISYYTHNAVGEALTGDIDTYAIRVCRLINFICKLTGSEKVSLVAHSMGGLVARATMTLSDRDWHRVHKLLTVGTPHTGVIASPEIVGQLTDLRRKSDFLTQLDKKWTHYTQKAPSINQRWGVVGAVQFPEFPIQKSSLDMGGPGFVEIHAAIPFGEWEAATQAQTFNTATTNTPHFGYRTAFESGHIGMLAHPLTDRGIKWVLEL